MKVVGESPATEAFTTLPPMVPRLRICGEPTWTAVSQRAGSFSDGQVKMITGEDEGYLVKFRALELWNELTEKLG